MFEVGTMISLDSDGWPVVAQPGDVVFGVVAGPPNALLGKLTVSLQDRPEQTIELFYQPQAIPPKPKKKKNTLLGLYSKYTGPAKKSKKLLSSEEPV